MRKQACKPRSYASSNRVTHRVTSVECRATGTSVSKIQLTRICSTQNLLCINCGVKIRCHAPLFSEAHRCKKMRISAFPHIFANILAYIYDPHHSVFAVTAWPSLVKILSFMQRCPQKSPYLKVSITEQNSLELPPF